MGLRSTMVALCLFSIAGTVAVTAQVSPTPSSGSTQTSPSAGSPAATPAQTPGPAVITGAQNGGTRVHGTITDPDGELVPGASITLTPAKGAPVRTKSGSDGTYSTAVTPGTYNVLVTREGFSTYSASGVKINAGSITLDAKLAIGENTVVINVDADAIQLSVDPDNNASSTVLKGADLDALSDDPDELTSELQALAGPAAGPNGGQIYVDGFTGGQLPPKSSIREIRINQNPFSAQYDRLGYGRIEVFTKPGTDKLHGNFQINGNPSQFDSGNPPNSGGTVQPGYHTIFMFGSITGPLGKNASYNIGGSHRDIEQDAYTFNPQLYASAAAPTVLCAPAQAGCVPITGAQFFTYNPRVRTDINPRLDLAFGSKNVLTTRFQYVTNSEINDGIGNYTLPSAGYNQNSETLTLQMSDTQTYSARLINETRGEYERDRSTTTALSNAPSVNVSGSFTGGGSASQNASDHQDHFEFQNYTSIQLKKNFVRLGGRFRSTREANITSADTNGVFSYGSIAAYQAGTPTDFTIARVNVPTFEYTMADLGVYAETDWKPMQNLTVSYGFRYETQNHIGDHHDIAPRVSFAYGLNTGKGAPKTVLRGGFGIFYDRYPGADILNTIRENGTNETIFTTSNAAAIPATCVPFSATYTFANCTAGLVAGQTQIYTRTPNLRTAYTEQFAFGIDEQVGKIGTVSVNYIHSLGVHELASQNVGYNFANPLLSPAYYQYFSEGEFHQDQMVLNSRVQINKYLSLFGYYALGFAAGDSTGAGTFISQPGNIHADYGRTGFDTRSHAFVAGSLTLPHFIQFSPYIQAQSGNPYNITSGFDSNHDTVLNDRPYLVTTGAASTGTNGVIGSIAGCGTFAQPGSQPAGSAIVPINYCTGPALFTFNFRLTKTFGFGEMRAATRGQNGSGGRGGGGGGFGVPGGGGRGGGPGGPGGGGGGSNTGHRYNLGIGLQAQNVFGNSDLATPNGALTSASFGQSTQLVGGPYTTSNAIRRVSLQASFSF